MRLVAAPLAPAAAAAAAAAAVVAVAVVVVAFLGGACDGAATDCGTNDDCNDASQVCARTIRTDTCTAVGTCVERAAEGEGCQGTDSFCGAAVDHPCQRGLICTPDTNGTGCQGSATDSTAFFSSCCRAPG